ncbi:MAG TPA: methyltransferase domain-containing protein [Candidatus Limnocylindrales bacterium]|nr:methyltransferase domain-containing protein [Candidatus Limnocylindrales bacterium]
MTAIDTRPSPDLAAIKQKQQATWSSGDYHMIGTQILITSERLLESLDVHSTERVLDVATGSGNAALAAARRGCDVTGIDYVPSLLEHARRRAAAEVLDATFMEGDAEALPFEDGAFDVVTSVFGAMFAPDQERTASELARVTRPGGRIGLVAHTPDGFIGQLFRTNAQHVPPAPGLRSPILWGTETRLRDLFGDAIADLQVRKRHFVFRYRSPEAYLEYWRHWYGPTLKAFEAVGADGEGALRQDLLALVARFNVAVDGSMAVPSEYLEAVITRR